MHTSYSVFSRAPTLLWGVCVQESSCEPGGAAAWDQAQRWIDQLRLVVTHLREHAGASSGQLSQTRHIGKLLARALELVGLKVTTVPPMQKASSGGGGAHLAPIDRISICEVGSPSAAALADHVILYCPATNGHVPAKDFRRVVQQQRMQAALARDTR